MPGKRIVVPSRFLYRQPQVYTTVTRYCNNPGAKWGYFTVLSNFRNHRECAVIGNLLRIPETPGNPFAQMPYTLRVVRRVARATSATGRSKTSASAASVYGIMYGALVRPR